MKKLFFAICIAAISLPQSSLSQGVSDSAKAAVQNTVNLINDKIKEMGYQWKADITPQSYLTEEQMKNLCGFHPDTSGLQARQQKEDSMYQQYKALSKQKLLKPLSTAPWAPWLPWMGKIRDQGLCGDCWAHAAAGVTIGLLHSYYGSNVMITLNELDISNHATCASGCNGTNYLDCGLSYIYTNKVETEQGDNQFPNYDHGYFTVSSYSDNTASIAAIKYALHFSPVLAGMDVYQDFQSYASGVYQHTWGYYLASHAVVIVGCDTVNDWWICKNSWGTGWGEREDGQPHWGATDSTAKGYFKIAFGQCNIESYGNITGTVTSDTCFARLIPSFRPITDALRSTFVPNEWAYVLSSQTVGTGATLTVCPGAYTALASGTSLTVNGTLSAAGTASNPITFTSKSATPAPGDWYGITLDGGPNALTYCNIYYPQYGIVDYNSSTNQLQNCTVQNASYCGVYAYNTPKTQGALSLIGCTLSQDYTGLAVNNGRADLQQTLISRTTNGNGISLINANVYMYQSNDTGNANFGVMVSGSTGYAYFSPDGSSAGYNQVYHNTQGQVDVESGAGALIGNSIRQCVCDDESFKSTLDILSTACNPPCYWQYSSYAGYNTIYGNPYWVNNNNSNTLAAQYTWWHTCPPPSADFSGPVDRSNYLSCSDVAAKASVLSPLAMRPSIDTAKVIGLIKYYNSLISDSPDSACDAIPHLAAFLGPGGQYASLLGEPWDLWLTVIAGTTTSHRLAEIASAYLIQEKMDIQDYDAAITLIQKTLATGPSDRLWYYCQSEKLSALLGKGDLAGATAFYSTFSARAKSIDPNETANLEELLAVADRNPVSHSSSQPPSVSDKQNNAKTVVLSQSYPNPFNPTTRISYNLPTNAYVVLKVYDVIGREVAVLVNSYQEAGFRSAEFNASSLPSGVYFYHLQVGNFSDVKKMLLMK